MLGSRPIGGFVSGMMFLLRTESLLTICLDTATGLPDVDWIRHAVNVFSFLMPGEVRVFAVSEGAAAREWIAGSECVTISASSPSDDSAYVWFAQLPFAQ